jgi:hypothetical protein
VDVETELQTYKHSRQGLDEMYNDARRQLRDESQLRQVAHIAVTLAESLTQQAPCPVALALSLMRISKCTPLMCSDASHSHSVGALKTVCCKMNRL